MMLRPGRGRSLGTPAERRPRPVSATLDTEPGDATDTAVPKGLFAAPSWLRELGRTSWFLVGFFLLVGGLAFLLGATSTIVGPVLGATIIAVVASPIVDRLDRHMPRAAAAAVVLLTIAALAVGVLLLVLAGIKDQSDSIAATASQGVDKMQAWLTDLGVDTSSSSAAGSSV